MTYGFLARSYDALTRDVNYHKLADYLERQFQKARCEVHTVLDLACGTGALTWLLASRGYEMIGVDLSEEMLAQAGEKRVGYPSVTPPLFLHQPMERLDLYGNIDACVCCLDSVNYVTRPAALGRAFQRIHLFLTPGGVFVFDIRTPEALREMDGQVFLDEGEDVFCVWRGHFSEKQRICRYYMDIFQKEGESWMRGQEEHREYAYTLEEMTALLRTAGFSSIRCYGGATGRRPKAGDDRVYFIARKEGSFYG